MIPFADIAISFFIDHKLVINIFGVVNKLN